MRKKLPKRILVFCLITIVVYQFCYIKIAIKNLTVNLNLLKKSITELFENIEKKPDFDKMKSITVQIKVGKVGGAGILIKGTKKYLYILTAQHITTKKGKVSVWILDSNNKFVKIYNINRKNVFMDRTTDLSLIKIPRPKGNFDYITFVNRSPNVGTKIHTIGEPLNFKYTLNEGIVSNYSDRISCTNIKAEYMQLSAPTIRGNSGGAVVNGKTELVGMIIGIMYIDGGLFENRLLFPNIAFAVKIEDIKRFLKDIE